MTNLKMSERHNVCCLCTECYELFLRHQRENPNCKCHIASNKQWNFGDGSDADLNRRCLETPRNKLSTEQLMHICSRDCPDNGTMFRDGSHLFDFKKACSKELTMRQKQSMLGLIDFFEECDNNCLQNIIDNVDGSVPSMFDALKLAVVQNLAREELERRKRK